MALSELAVIFGGAIIAGLITLLVAGPRAPKIEQRMAALVAAGLIGLWVVIVGGLAVAQHMAFRTHAYDLAIFDQVIWNTAQGRLFQNSVMADSPNFLGHHFSPLLLALAPIYWVYPDASALLVTQTLALALAGVPLFLFARERLGNGLALAVLLSYLLHPATTHIALFDFHEIALAVPLLAFALLFLLRRRYVPFAVSAVLAALVKEDVALIVAAMGGYLALQQGRRAAGLAIAGAGTIWTLILIRFVIPSFHPSGQYFFNALYADIGASPVEATFALLRDPASALARIFSPSKLLYLQQLLAPLAALPLAGWPVLAIAAPPLLYLLVGGFPGNLIEYQYSAPILAPLLFACTAGIAALRDRCKPYWRPMGPAIGALLVTSAAIGAYLYGPLPMARGFQADRYAVTPRIAVAREMMASIPPAASVIAQSDLVPQLSHRQVVQAFGMADASLRTDFYLFDTDSRASRYPLSYEDEPYFAALARVAADAEYRTAAARDGYLLLRRVVAKWQTEVSAIYGGQIELVGYTLAERVATPGGTVELEVFWRAVRRPDANYTAFVHLIDSSGTRRGQRDGYPVGDLYPTAEWETNALLRGSYAIPVAADAGPGDYQLQIGLYDLATMQQLRRAPGSEPADSILIGGITVR